MYHLSVLHPKLSKSNHLALRSGDLNSVCGGAGAGGGLVGVWSGLVIDAEGEGEKLNFLFVLLITVLPYITLHDNSNTYILTYPYRALPLGFFFSPSSEICTHVV